MPRAVRRPAGHPNHVVRIAPIRSAALLVIFIAEMQVGAPPVSGLFTPPRPRPDWQPPRRPSEIVSDHRRRMLERAVDSEQA